MKRKIISTSDGSKTIQIEEWNEQYHSVHGALNEAMHVFIKQGLYHTWGLLDVNRPLSILEIGFGTGLNAFLTFIEVEKNRRHVDYVGVEAYPVIIQELELLGYPEFISPEHSSQFYMMHQTDWGIATQISSHFSLKREHKFFKNITLEDQFNLIYFDAFGARVQPELWTEAIFKIMYSALKAEGVLVTYAAKGSVRRAMQAVGFKVERLPGPPGKREMLRASKDS